MDRKKELLWRAYLVMFVFVIATIVILFKVFKVGVLEQDKWKQKGEVNVKWRTVDADRGNIYAEGMNSGDVLLSTSLQFFEVRMDMKVVKDEVFYKYVDSLAIYLSKFDSTAITRKSTAQWKKDLVAAKKKKNEYFYIGKGLDIEAFNKIKQAPILRLGKYRGGLIDVRYGKRVKPYRELASRTIGVDRENADRIGLEGYFDKYLKGDTDQRLMKRLSQSEDIWVPVYDPSENEIIRGDDILTTINIDMQDAVHHELLAACEKYSAEGATAILMEVGTGAIKAISNLTRVDDGNYYEIYNQGVGRLSEPGSTMKLATVLALMEDGVTNTDTLVKLNYGMRKFADRTMHDSEKHGREYATMTECFEISSNVGIAALANDFYNSSDGRKKWVKKLANFGLNEPTGIDLSGEALPEIKDPVKNKDKWYGTTIPWMAHGYELMMTPLQMLNFYNAVANQGRMMKPYLVSEIRKGDEIRKKFEPKVLKPQIASLENIKKAQKMLEGVVLRGTAKNLQSPYLSLAGKTGTTKTNYANVGEYAKYNASFCGYFPAENPMYSMIVVVYNPKGVYYGGYVAGPVFKHVAEKVYAMKTQQATPLNDNSLFVSTLPTQARGYRSDFSKIFEFLEIDQELKNKETWAKVNPSTAAMNVEGFTIKNNLVPDVVGMGIRDALFLLENKGLKVKIEGAGRVYRQSILGGASAHGQTVVIYLN